MKSTICTSLEELKIFLINKTDELKERINIDGSNYSAVGEIAEFYNEYGEKSTKGTVESAYNGLMPSSEKFKIYNSLTYISLNILIKITRIEDYRHFLKFYCEQNGTTLRKIYKKIEFDFEIILNERNDITLIEQYQNNIFLKFGNSCKNMSAKIKGIEDMSNTILLNQNSEEFNELVFQNKGIFEDVFYREKNIILNINVEKKGFDLNKLHNNILVCCKYKDFCRGFILNIKGDLARVKPYVQSIISEKVFVICNNILVMSDVKSVGKIPPAIYFGNEELSFFTKPLSYETWKKVKQPVAINSNSFYNSCEKRNWPYLRICQKYLFEEFDDNLSVEYTNLRNKAYSSDTFFKEYVHKMPFLALCIFSFYDNFYRNNLLNQAKKYYNDIRLKKEDLLLSEQKYQMWNKFVQYRNNREKYDVKNLFAYDEKGKLHKTVISEIFECISIAEGILQILENAVLHAGGGLLSMRIYSRAEGLKTKVPKKTDHVQYLDSVYQKDYFDYKQADFYLEIRISDLSGKSIPQKFVENLLSPDNKNGFNKLVTKYDEKSEEVLNAIENMFENPEYNLRYFFAKSDDLSDVSLKFKQFRKKYYSINENLVHHYGLEIFNNILTVRDGLFSVCGYGLSYDNLDSVFEHIYSKEKTMIEKLLYSTRKDAETSVLHRQKSNIEKVRKNITGNVKISGTTYSILFPLIHSSPTDNYTITDSPIYANEMDSSNYHSKTITTEDILPIINYDTIFSKRESINKIAQNISKKNMRHSVICLNMSNINSCCFEEVMKGIILFALNELSVKSTDMLPIAIVNLSPFQLVEAARIISIYYAKEILENENETNQFEKMPIYLRCSENGKEVIFNGSNIEEVKRNLIKTAMVNGTMFDEIENIVDILRKETR